MLSVIVPSIRPQNLQRLYESVRQAYGWMLEFIVVSPHPRAGWLPFGNVTWIVDYGSPTRAQQLGILSARGEYVLWGAADDGYFLPGTVDLAVDRAAPRTVVAGKYYEGSDNPAMNERKYYLVNTHDGQRSKFVNDECLMLMVGVISRSLLLELGGVDCEKFESLPMAFNDLSVRLWHLGIEVILQDEVMFRCSHMPGHTGDHGPIHDAQTLHDEPMFKSIYNAHESLSRVDIDINNWTRAPARWERRFGA